MIIVRVEVAVMVDVNIAGSRTTCCVQSVSGPFYRTFFTNGGSMKGWVIV